jgi:hypothetical protein
MTIQDAIREVTNALGLSPYDINNGYCYEWAEQVYERLASTHKVELWEVPFGMGDTSHAFLRIDGRFYDAELPAGVEDHAGLPLFTKLPPQPVWAIDANHDLTQGRRNITQEMLVQYDLENGTSNSLLQGL